LHDIFISLLSFFTLRYDKDSADKTLFLILFSANCLRSVQTNQGQEKLFDL